jgi:hypothetical protein
MKIVVSRRRLRLSVMGPLALLALVSTGVARADASPSDTGRRVGPLLPPRPRRSVDVQLDPTPFFLKGYAPEIGFSAGKHRIYGTFLAYEVPKFLAEDKAFVERRWIGALGYQFFFLDHVRGPFAAANLGVTRSRFTLAETGGVHLTTTFKSTFRFGWAFAPFDAVPELFFAPWIGPVFSFGAEDFAVDGRAIKRRPFGVVGALQVGWRFAL